MRTVIAITRSTSSYAKSQEQNTFFAQVFSTRFPFYVCYQVKALDPSFVYSFRSTRSMTLSDASVAEVRRRAKRRQSSLHPPIRGRATSIYLRKEGTGVEHTETRGLTPQEETRHTPLFRMVHQERYLLSSARTLYVCLY